MGPDEIKIKFTGSDELKKSGATYIKIYLPYSDDKGFEDHFDVKDAEKEFKFKAESDKVIKSMRDRELSLTLKKQKMLVYKTNLDQTTFKLNGLGSKSVVGKTVTLNNIQVPIEVTVNKALRTNEMEVVKDVKKALGPIPAPFKSSAQAQGVTPAQAKPAQPQ